MQSIVVLFNLLAMSQALAVTRTQTSTVTVEGDSCPALYSSSATDTWSSSSTVTTPGTWSSSSSTSTSATWSSSSSASLSLSSSSSSSSSSSLTSSTTSSSSISSSSSSSTSSSPAASTSTSSTACVPTATPDTSNLYTDSVAGATNSDPPCGVFDEVTGSFTVPNVEASDDEMRAVVLQIGLQPNVLGGWVAKTSNGSVEHALFYSFEGSFTEFATVSPGDKFTVTCSNIGTAICQFTGDQTFTTPSSAPAHVNFAAWSLQALEFPYPNGTSGSYDLPIFDPIVVTDATALTSGGGSADPSTSRPTYWLYDSNRTQVAYPTIQGSGLTISHA